MANQSVTPVIYSEIISTKSQTTNANNTTANTPIFRITGTIEVRGLWGVITTTLGANHTGGLWRLNDQAAQISITTGATLSALAAGTVLVKKGLVAAAGVVLNNVAGVISEPTTLETIYF